MESMALKDEDLERERGGFKGMVRWRVEGDRLGYLHEEDERWVGKMCMGRL